MVNSDNFVVVERVMDNQCSSVVDVNSLNSSTKEGSSIMCSCGSYVSASKNLYGTHKHAYCSSMITHHFITQCT